MSTHPEEMKIVQKKYISVISGGKKIGMLSCMF